MTSNDICSITTTCDSSSLEAAGTIALEKAMVCRFEPRKAVFPYVHTFLLPSSRKARHALGGCGDGGLDKKGRLQAFVGGPSLEAIVVQETTL